MVLNALKDRRMLVFGGGAEEEGAVFLQPSSSIRCNYKWPRAERTGEPIRSRLACQPKTNCLLALTAQFLPP